MGSVFTFIHDYGLIISRNQQQKDFVVSNNFRGTLGLAMICAALVAAIVMFTGGGLWQAFVAYVCTGILVPLFQLFLMWLSDDDSKPRR
jgi:hypothetical protein